MVHSGKFVILSACICWFTTLEFNIDWLRPLIFYPMSAVLSIFCSILQTPSDPQATSDLELLQETTGMMERIFFHQLCSVNEVVHIKVVADFVAELYRLANCAVEKAANERLG